MTEPDEDNGNQMSRSRVCDYCNEVTALLYCRADAARLCLRCDQEVHSTNRLFSNHTRFLLCDSCHSSPASILCETERFVLCHNCDWERHPSPSTTDHPRRPVEGFTGCPSAAELGSILGFDDVGWEKEKEKECDGYFNDDGDVDGLLVWGTVEVLGLDDLVVSGSGSGSDFQALGVPPLPENRNAACGQYKDEMLCQLRNLGGSNPDLNYMNPEDELINAYESPAVRRNLQSKSVSTGFEPYEQPYSFPPHEENVLQWRSDPGEAANQVLPPATLLRSNYEESSVVPDKQSKIGGSINHARDGPEAELLQHPVHCRGLPAVPKVSSHEFNSQERDSAISRYKEKKKTRRYVKHIRYESRKVRAESRTRIRGRFAKTDP